MSNSNHSIESKTAGHPRTSSSRTHSVRISINNSHQITTPHNGTGLAASTPLLKPGSLILQLPHPNLLVIENESLQSICSCCITKSAAEEEESLKRCSGCKIPYYCSTACQNEHWKECHARECKLLRRLRGVPPTAVRALMVMLLRGDGGAQGEEESQWKGLESHVGELKAERKRWEEIVLQARAGVEFTKVGAGRMEEAMRWLCVLSTNAFRITLPDNTHVGLCFSSTLARANHSCSPNAFIVFDSRTVSLRTLRPIKKDEEIFISYIDPTEDLAKRQSTLKERYFFTCRCKRCEGNENAYEHFLHCEREDAAARGEESESENLMDVLFPRVEILETAERCREAIKLNPGLAATSLAAPAKSESISDLLPTLKLTTITTTHKPLPLAIPPFPTTLHTLYLLYIESQTFIPSLLTLLTLHLTSDIYTYPQPHHPIRVLRLYTIAKLLKHLSSLTPVELLEDISSIQIQRPPTTAARAAEGASPYLSTSSSSSSSSLALSASPKPTARSSPSAQEQEQDLKEEIAKTFQKIDLITAFHVVIVLVLQQSRRCHGEQSAFVREVEGEVREVEDVQRMRIKGGGMGAEFGEALRRCVDAGGGSSNTDREARKEVERVGRELRALAELMEKILSGGFTGEIIP